MRQLLPDAATVQKLISAAVAAPSFFNTQPWRFRLDPGTATVEVHARPDQALRHLDPIGRALHISVGAALFNLRLAVAHYGWRPVVALLPRPDAPQILATVQLGGPPHHVDPQQGDALYDAIWHRHSSRVPFEPDPLPPRLLTDLAEAAHAEGALLTLPDAAETTRLLALTAEAERRTTGNPVRRAESRRWVREGGPEGQPHASLGPQDATGRLPVRDFAALRPDAHQPAQPFEAAPTIAVLSTAYDRRVDWLRAGQALERVLLVATTETVRASLMHQALEWPDLRWQLRDPSAGPGHVQMLIRLGYGPAGRQTPRRGARDILQDTGGLTAAPHTDSGTFQESRVPPSGPASTANSPPSPAAR